MRASRPSSPIAAASCLRFAFLLTILPRNFQRLWPSTSIIWPGDDDGKGRFFNEPASLEEGRLPVHRKHCGAS